MFRFKFCDKLKYSQQTVTLSSLGCEPSFDDKLTYSKKPGLQGFILVADTQKTWKR
jgi:hypothetical protein